MQVWYLCAEKVASQANDVERKRKMAAVHARTALRGQVKALPLVGAWLENTAVKGVGVVIRLHVDVEVNFQ